MYKIFIDLGANNGDTMLAHQDEFDWVYGLEPNPLCHKPDGLMIERLAAWSEDCEKPFYLDSQPNKTGSTLFKQKQKPTLDKDNPILVSCTDTATMLGTVTYGYVDLHLTVNMDIEGAEYTVLPHLIQTADTLNIINVLYLEFHQQQLGVSNKDHDALVKSLKENFKGELYIYPCKEFKEFNAE